MQTFYKLGLYLNKVEIGFNSDCNRFCKATEDIYDKIGKKTIELKSELPNDNEEI